jgi:hypothetical protein
MCALVVLSLHSAGGTSYKSVVKPVPQLSVLSPELENLTDVAIETYLTADVRPVFPSVLAVAKVRLPKARSYRRRDQGESSLETLRGEEAEGWRHMIGPVAGRGETLLEQVQLVSPLIVNAPMTLKSLRNAAALLHASLLLVYVPDDNHSEGYNNGAMASWTIVGLFIVPGNTVGHYTTCQGVGNGLVRRPPAFLAEVGGLPAEVSRSPLSPVESRIHRRGRSPGGSPPAGHRPRSAANA